MSKIDNDLFSTNKHALEKEYEVCPKCGSELVMRNSKSGPFLGCASYPSCDFIRSLHEHDTSVVKELDKSCPECSSNLAVKNGRYGLFIGCTGFPDCNYIADLAHEEDNTVSCPVCKTGEIVQRANKFGKSFYACNGYPKCKFLVNHQPLPGECEKCGFGLLLKRSKSSGERRQCADKKCGHFQSDDN